MKNLILGLLCSFPASLFAQSSQPAPPQQTAHFHHVHLNTTDPAAAIDFYTTKFKARKEKFAGLVDGVWTGDSWLLFTRVAQAPPSAVESGIWHIGWGGEDMPAVYQQQVDSGTKFATPLTDISEMVGGNRKFFYAYVDGPDHALIELNTARHHNFGHVHMFSADAPAAGEWYAKQFGVRLFAQKDQRIYNGVQIAPSAFVTADHVSMIIYPVGYLSSRAGQQGQPPALVPTRGRVIDHLGFSVDDLDATLGRMRKDGVKVTAEPRSIANGQIELAFIEGPDQVAIELIEDHTARPGPVAD